MQTLSTLTSRHFVEQEAWPADVVRLDDLKRVLNAPASLQNLPIWVGMAAILTVQIAGPAGLATTINLPGPTWLYPALAVIFLFVAVAVRLATERDRVAMEINSLRLRNMKDAAARGAMAARD